MLTSPNVLNRKLWPWEENPYQLVSFDMFLRAAYLFWSIGHAVDSLLQEAVTKPLGGQRFPPHVMHQPIDDELRQKAFKTCDLIAAECADLGMPFSAETAKELYSKINAEAEYSYDSLMHETAALQKLIHKEVKDKVYLYMTPERSKFWPKTDEFIFGEDVVSKFPSTRYDTNEAAACIGLARGTAGVFHLMRVLEIGLSALCKKFNVSMEHTNWHNAIEQVEKNIKLMGQDPAWKAQKDWKDQQEFYSQAISHLHVVKDAWRNYTAHSRGKFTEEEAQDMFNDIKRFMQKLAKRLSE